VDLQSSERGEVQAGAHAEVVKGIGIDVAEFATPLEKMTSAGITHRVDGLISSCIASLLIGIAQKETAESQISVLLTEGNEVIGAESLAVDLTKTVEGFRAVAAVFLVRTVGTEAKLIHQPLCKG